MEEGLTGSGRVERAVGLAVADYSGRWLAGKTCQVLKMFSDP